MPQPEASKAFYRRLQRLQLVVIMAGRKAWSRMGPDFDSSWARVAPGLLAVTSAGQLAAATEATSYVPAVLDETGQPDTPEARVLPRAFAGVAADGRSLPGLLQGAVVQAKRAAPTLPPEQALEQGGRRLDMLLQGVVTDAARGATQAEVAVRPHLGFVRLVNPPCCIRCAILAGRWYRYDAGFKRHPQCDCSIIPTTREGWERLSVDPKQLLSDGLVHGLTRRERDRLDAGDDLFKVGNASRDMWRARLAEQRRADNRPEDAATKAAQSRQGLEDLFASTRSRVDALQAMKAQGYTA